ncbi:hypothetical protein BC826DRAFT_575294 [Russula brevipes]|nr:hypothetical protein BC826DRAFT_575294 [Russula brevipes]
MTERAGQLHARGKCDPGRRSSPMASPVLSPKVVGGCRLAVIEAWPHTIVTKVPAECYVLSCACCKVVFCHPSHMRAAVFWRKIALLFSVHSTCAKQTGKLVNVTELIFLIALQTYQTDTCPVPPASRAFSLSPHELFIPALSELNFNGHGDQYRGAARCGSITCLQCIYVVPSASTLDLEFD